MPTKGYRKGASDSREPLNKHLQTYVNDATYRDFATQADERSITDSQLLRRIIQAHLEGQRAALPHRNVNAAAIRELARIGNNLNQLAKQANNALVPLSETELRHNLVAVLKAIDAL